MYKIKLISKKKELLFTNIEITNNKMTDPIWINDITILLKTDKLIEFIPNVEMSNNQRHNSLVRLSIYVGLLLWIINKNYLYLYVPVIVIALSYFIYAFSSPTYLNNTPPS